MNYRRNRGSFRMPKPRELSQATVEANRKKFHECPATIEGRGIGKGMVFVGESTDTLYRVETIGFRSQEECPPMFGVKPIRPTPEWKATVTLRNAIKGVFERGVAERGARNDSGQGQEFPGGEKVMEWHDGRYDSLASFPYLTVYAGGLLRAVKPNYDDSPSVAWLVDAKLADSVIAAAQVSPRPVKLPEYSVTQKPQKASE